jgi:hypothetical protein
VALDEILPTKYDITLITQMKGLEFHQKYNKFLKMHPNGTHIK